MHIRMSQGPKHIKELTKATLVRLIREKPEAVYEALLELIKENQRLKREIKTLLKDRP
jgi:hypothetical protein